MFRLVIIEESLEHRDVLKVVKPHFVSQRIEHVPDDEYPIWHTNEYHVPNDEIDNLLEQLTDEVKLTWYIHAFSEDQLYVVLKGKCFLISPYRDDTWNSMIEYGVDIAKVERSFLENIPLHI